LANKMTLFSVGIDKRKAIILQIKFRLFLNR
jgi:hypothetical protein